MPHSASLTRDPTADAIIVPRIRVAKLLMIAGLLAVACVVFSTPVLALVVLFGVSAFAELDPTTIAFLALISAIPATIIGAFLVTLLLYGAVGWWATPRGGFFSIDIHDKRITDALGRCWHRASNAPGRVVRGRGGGAYSLVLSDVSAPAARSLASWIADAFATLWSAAPPTRHTRIVVPPFLLTDVDAILATQTP
jgi:hypothetical protein